MDNHDPLRLTRRHFLSTAAFGLGALSLAEILGPPAQAQSAFTQHADAHPRAGLFHHQPDTAKVAAGRSLHGQQAEMQSRAGVNVNRRRHAARVTSRRDGVRRGCLKVELRADALGHVVA